MGQIRQESLFLDRRLHNYRLDDRGSLLPSNNPVESGAGSEDFDTAAQRWFQQVIGPDKATTHASFVGGAICLAFVFIEQNNGEMPSALPLTIWVSSRDALLPSLAVTLCMCCFFPTMRSGRSNTRYVQWIPWRGRG